MRYREKIRAIIALLMVFSSIFPPAAEIRFAYAARLEPPAAAPGKNEVGVDDDGLVKNSTRKANVLFFIDTSHSMMFDSKGKIPYVVTDSAGKIDSDATFRDYGYTSADAIEMMRHVTFGVGTVPMVDSFYTTPIYRGVNYGRDTNPDNNLVPVYTAEGKLDLNDSRNRYRYYSPYDKKHGLKTTFQNQSDAYIDDISKLGYKYNTTSAINNGNPLPYMLVFKNPAYWANGKSNFVSDDLVPNDSRLYQAKLVMWRLLEDETLFRNIRFGMATILSYTASGLSLSSLKPKETDKDGSYFVDYYAKITHTAYAVDPWGRSYAADMWGRYVNYDDYLNGVYYINQSGDLCVGSNLDHQRGAWAVNDKDNYALRAFLRVPIAEFDKKWTTIGGKVTMTHMERFKQWIDGVEDIAGQLSMGANTTIRSLDLNANQFDIYRNPELMVSNYWTPLSRTIFPKPGVSDNVSATSLNPNRNWYFDQGGVAYAKKDAIFYDPMRIENSNSYNFYFKPGSGQAVGSVHDFFSPDYEKFGPGSGLNSSGSYRGVPKLGYTNSINSNPAYVSSESFDDLIPFARSKSTGFSR